MKISELLTEHREFMLRCLCLTGIKVTTDISSPTGLFKLSGIDLGDQEVKEIHILDDGYTGIFETIESMGFALKMNYAKWKIFVPKEEILNGEQFSGTFQAGDIVLVNGDRYSGQKAAIFICNSADEYFVLITDKGEIFEVHGVKNLFDKLIFLDKSKLKIPAKAKQVHEMFLSGLLKCIFE